MALPARAMVAKALAIASGITVVAGGLALLHSVEAAMGVAFGALAATVAPIAGLAIIGPTKPRPVLAWHGMLFAAQAISLPLAAMVALALLYSATRPAQVAALPTAAVVFITVWIAFAKSYGHSARGAQSES